MYCRLLPVTFYINRLHNSIKNFIVTARSLNSLVTVWTVVFSRCTCWWTAMIKRRTRHFIMHNVVVCRICVVLQCTGFRKEYGKVCV